MNYHSVYLLLVEDDCEDAQLTIRELERLHLANGLVHVKDGDGAFDFLLSEGKYAGAYRNRSLPTIIMLDIETPKENGLLVLKRIKEDSRTNQTPIILLTSSREHPDLHDCYKLGATCYIVKPLNFERFAQAIHSLGLFWLLLDRAPQRASL